MSKSECLVQPTFDPKFNLEYSIHKPSRLLRKDIEVVFRPDLEEEFSKRGFSGDLDDFLAENLLAVPTWQPASQDLSEMCSKVSEERKSLLDQFDLWALAVRVSHATNLLNH